MRALLINPWIYDFAAYDLWAKPLGLLTIAGYLRERGHEIRLLDCLDRFHPALPHAPQPDAHYGSGTYRSEEIPAPAIFRQITRRYKRYGLPLVSVRNILAAEKRPDTILMTSGMTYWYPAVRDMTALVKEIFPGVPVILGGNYANICYAHARYTSGADHVYRGLSPAGAIGFIESVAGFPRADGPGRRARNPLPAYDLYATLPCVTLKTSHGCPFRCTYCGWYLIDERFSRQDPDEVVDGIVHFYRTRMVRNFAFYDDALLYDAEGHFMKIARGIMERGIDARFLTPNGLHNRFLTGEVARLMKAAGFVNPRLALETASAGRQRLTGAKTTTRDFTDAVRNLTATGYPLKDIGVYMLIGLPGQDPAEVERSVRVAADEGVRIHLEEYSPIPGTAEYRRSGLAPDADPLLHNNSAFPLHAPGQHTEIQRLKDSVHALNRNCR